MAAGPIQTFVPLSFLRLTLSLRPCKREAHRKSLPQPPRDNHGGRQDGKNEVSFFFFFIISFSLVTFLLATLKPLSSKK